jgi:steroid 5-alpha reductase family enzyme
VKLKQFIDSHKAATAFVVLSLIIYYRQWDNPTAWVYLALHGTYGILWVLKSRIFPDRQWEQPATLVVGLSVWVILSLYWIAPWLITVQARKAPAWYLALCIAIYTFGIFFHFVSDMQKHVALELRPNRLVKEGLWRKLRNPNYFGELLVYLGFGLLAMHRLPPLALALVVAVVWVSNMLKKDRSLSRYPDYAAYKASSKWLIPLVL